MKKYLTLALGLVAVATPAFAQDFGVGWLDRISHETEPVQPEAKDVNLLLNAGELYYYDTNINLDNKTSDQKASSVLVSFLEGRVTYSQPDVDIAADAVVNYNLILNQSSSSDNEERAFARFRWVGPEVDAQIAEVFTRSSDPTDAFFTNKVSRIVSTTTGQLSFNPMPEITADLNGKFSIVKFDNSQFNTVNNYEYRAGGSVAYNTADHIAFSVDGGISGTRYQDSAAPSDTNGYFLGAGVAGQLLEPLYFTGRGGYTYVKTTDVVASSGSRKDFSTAEFGAGLRYDATAQATFWGDYGRFIGYSIGAPYQTNDVVGGRVEYKALEELTILGRISYGRGDQSDGVVRWAVNSGGEATYKVHTNVSINGGITYRYGQTAWLDTANFSNGDFIDWVFHVGVVASY